MEQEIFDRAVTGRMKLPEVIANRPELELGRRWYMDVFDELSADRSFGFGVGPIPSATIRQFIKDEKLDIEEGADLKYIIRKMDETYLKYQQEEADRQKDKK